MSTQNQPRKGGTKTVTQAEGEKLEREWAEKMSHGIVRQLEREWADKMEQGIVKQPAPVIEQEEPANAD